MSYGGNDDGAGVATLLETARAVMAGPPPVNDLVFLFTDAEEACLCGSEAFVSQSPLAAQGGVAMNFESRGSTGPAVMFETNRGNADVVSEYGSAVPYPVATSFAVEIYRILPNNTDFTPFRESGRFTGLNTAYIDGSPVYHTPQDKPSTMNVASLQQHGANAVALARAFGTADIAELAVPTSYDSTYFPALGILVRYPGWLNWPLGRAGPDCRWRIGICRASPGARQLAAGGGRIRAGDHPAASWHPLWRNCSGRCWWRCDRNTRTCPIRGGRAGSGCVCWPWSPPFSSPGTGCSAAPSGSWTLIIGALGCWRLSVCCSRP